MSPIAFTPAHWLIAAFVPFCLPGAECRAGDADFSLGVHLRHHRIEERSASGAPLLTETGWLPMVEGRMVLPLPKGSVAAGFSLSDGTLDYSGHTQSGSTFGTLTTQRIWRGGLGYQLPFHLPFQLHFGGGMEGRIRWEAERRERRIEGHSGIAGMDEDYLRHSAALGVVWQPLAEVQGFSITAEWIKGIAGHQTIRSAGLIDPVTLPAGALRGVSLEARIPLYAPAGGLRWTLVPHGETLHTARSESRPFTTQGQFAGTIAQPETRRWQVGAGLELAW